jgi:DNA repair protein RadA
MAKKEIPSLEDLPGVGEATAEKLSEAGFKTVESIAVAAVGELMDATGMTESACKKIINGAGDSLEMGFETAADLMERRSKVGKMTTGSVELDKLFGGGIETQSITELYGRYGSGKSQLAFQLCVNAQLPREKGGMEGGALFIDTENTFRPSRIQQMSAHLGMDPNEALKNIYVARAFNSDHQMILAEKAADLVKEKNIKLIVVDSLTSLFRSEYAGRGTLANRQQKLNRHMHALQKIADLNNLCVVVTNQVMANPGLLFGDPTTPVGGHIVGHQSTFRVYLRKSQNEKRIAKMVDSPHLPDSECVFRVTEDGVVD